MPFDTETLLILRPFIACRFVGLFSFLTFSRFSDVRAVEQIKSQANVFGENEDDTTVGYEYQQIKLL